MRNQEAFRSYFDSELLPKLEKLESVRLNSMKTVYLFGGFTAAVVLCFFSLFLNGYNPLVVIVLIPSMFCTGYFGFQYYQFKKNFKQRYKEEVIRSMIHKINPDLRYSPKKSISKEVFERSGIFRKDANSFKGDDLIEGKIGKTAFRFSEINAESIRSNGENSSKDIVFKGLFFEADFNKHFNNDLFVLEDRIEKHLGKIGTMFQKANFNRPKLVQMEDVEFEKLFVIYGDDPVEARYILTPDMMSRIVELRSRVGQLNISFVKSKMFIAITDPDDNFEPSYLASLVDYEKLEGYYIVLLLCLDLIEDFDLNTRIWTKD